MSRKIPGGLHALETCALQLHNWRPFQIHTRTLDSDPPKPYSIQTNGFLNKRPCRADRATSLPFDAIDLSKLSLFDDDRPLSAHKRGGGIRWHARKRRRRGSRSVSGRSTDRSGTRRRCCSVGAAAAANGTCSDFLVAAGTDSSGEMFVNGDMNWASDVSEAVRNLRKEREQGNADKENLSCALQNESQYFESGYGSEPGYRGDAELGYGDEFDEEDDDQRILFWCHEFGVSKREKVGENTLQKAHHRCRRRKQDLKMVDLMRWQRTSLTTD